MSQSSPGSMTGASSADATVMTTPTGSRISGEGTVNAKKAMKRFTRSTWPRTNIARSPKRSIERVEIEDAKGMEEREIQLIEELRSAKISYQ